MLNAPSHISAVCFWRHIFVGAFEIYLRKETLFSFLIMSCKKAKKKKMSALFDPDNVKNKLAEQDMVLADIREHLRAVKETDMKQLMNSTLPLSENKALQVLVCKLTVKRLENLKIAIQNVPDNVPRVIDGIQLRLTYIYKIFNALSKTNCDTGLSVEDVRDYVAFIETYCPSFLSKQDCQNKLDKLWELTVIDRKYAVQQIFDIAAKDVPSL